MQSRTRGNIFSRLVPPGGGRGYKGRKGFTLLELLIAMAVLSVLTVLLVQVFSGVSNNTTSSTKRLKSNANMRTVMDRIGFDIASLERRGNAVPIFTRNYNGNNDKNKRFNDTLTFLSNARSFTSDPTSSPSDGRISEIIYCIGTYNPSASMDPGQPAEPNRTGLANDEISRLGPFGPMLCRASVPVKWTDDLTAFNPSQVSQTAASKPANDLVSATNFQVLNPDIFRLEIYFQLIDGSITSNVPLLADNITANWQVVQSIHMAFAALDQQTRATMTSAQIAALPSEFRDFDATPNDALYNAADPATGATRTPVALWNLDLLNTNPALMPPQARKAVRFYEASYGLQ